MEHQAVVLGDQPESLHHCTYWVGQILALGWEPGHAEHIALEWEPIVEPSNTGSPPCRREHRVEDGVEGV